MLGLLGELGQNKRGATAVEYGLIAALIAVAATAVMAAVGDSLSTVFGLIASTL